MPNIDQKAVTASPKHNCICQARAVLISNTQCFLGKWRIFFSVKIVWPAKFFRLNGTASMLNINILV